MLGPLIALLYLFFYPVDYKRLFLFAFIPGIAAIIFTWLAKEKKTDYVPKNAIPFHQTFRYWKEANVSYRKLLIGLLLFALFNSSDVFLLLKMKAAGLSDTSVIAVYIFYNLIFALAAFPLGKLADRIGMRNIFLMGLLFFCITYTGFALTSSIPVFIALFFCYGIYAAATDGISKAWISNLVPKTETASAIGLYTGLQSIAALIASSLAGFLWFRFGAVIVFSLAAIVALLAFAWITLQLPRQK